MVTLEFEIQISASREQIWEALWADANYRYWTEVFAMGSYAVTNNWLQGSEVQFLLPDGRGMYSLIEQHEPLERMCFRHLGSIAEGRREPFPPPADNRECYSLTDSGKGVRLSARLETEPEAEPFFNDRFPVALRRVKARAESLKN